MNQRSKAIAAAAAGLLGVLALAAYPAAASASGGTLVVYSAGPAGLANQLVAAFEQRTGIQVQLFQSTTGKVLGRLQAEKSNPHADVVMLADWSAGDALQQEGMLQPFHPTNGQRAIWKGAQGMYYAYSASALGITYNTNLVKDPPQTWLAALNPQWDGKIVMPDPAQSGSAVDFVGGYLQTQVLGMYYFKDLGKYGAVVQGANAEALNQVITGAKDMVLAGVDYMAYADIAKGEPLGIVYPKEGTVVNPRPVMILKSAHNLANARLFEDFVLSDAGQAIVAKNYLLPGAQGYPADPRRVPLSGIHAWTVNWADLAQHKASYITSIDSALQ
jgi:iron(III) transport system substrate-binding protein